MSIFANLVAAVAVALRDIDSTDSTTREGAAIRALAYGNAEPQQKALSFAVRSLERWTLLMLDDIRSEQVAMIVDEHVDVEPLAAADTTSALIWLRAFDDSVHKNCANLARVLAFTQHTTLPHVVSSALVRAHAMDWKPSTPPSMRAEQDGGISWRLVPNVPGELVLVVPVDDVDEGHLVGLRRALSGSVLRTWWACWELAFAQKSSEGLFEVDMRHVILDLFGMRPEVQTKNGQRYFRPPRRIEQQVDRALSVLERTLVGGIDDITVENPEPLIHRYGQVRQDGRVVRDRQYAHARLAWAARRKSFIQLPRLAFRLDANDAPLAMGIATLLRSRARDWLPGGALTMPLKQLADAVGEDAVSGQLRGGKAYWGELRHRLGRVIPGGGFGTIRFGAGLDGDVLATIELWPPLAAAYSSYPSRLPRTGAGPHTPLLSS